MNSEKNTSFQVVRLFSFMVLKKKKQLDIFHVINPCTYNRNGNAIFILIMLLKNITQARVYLSYAEDQPSFSR